MRQRSGFIDQIRVFVRGGTGGTGSMSYAATPSGKKRADGGNGGNGGNVYILAEAGVKGLNFPTRHFEAASGGAGTQNGRHGRQGKDTIIRVPLGTVVREVRRVYADEEEGVFPARRPEDFSADPDVVQGLREPEVDGVRFRSYYEFGSATPYRRPAEQDEPRVKAPPPPDDSLPLETLARQYGLTIGDDGEGGGAMSLHAPVVSGGVAGGGGPMTAAGPMARAEEEEESEGGFALEELAARHGYMGTADDEGEASEGGESSEEAPPAVGAYEDEIHFVADMDSPSTLLLVAEGGAAGRGSKSNLDRDAFRERNIHHVRGMPGQERYLEFELKLLADVGLVGYPNAGKSTLLRALSRARPQVAAYPFTTLHPTVGVVEFKDWGRFSVADIPGLVDGASENRGLGHEFLKHIERTELLLFVVDASAGQGRTALQQWEALRRELRAYSPALAEKPCAIASNKMDFGEEAEAAFQELAAAVKREQETTGANIPLLPISAERGVMLNPLARTLRDLL